MRTSRRIVVVTGLAVTLAALGSAPVQAAAVQPLGRQTVYGGRWDTADSCDHEGKEAVRLEGATDYNCFYDPDRNLYNLWLYYY